MHIVLIYIGIFCGIFFEGEMVMITSVIAAHHGYLDLWVVMAIGLTGTYASDSFYFFLGRKKGKGWLDKNSRFKEKYATIDAKLEKYPILIFLIYRFMYGFRTITPLVIGASKTKTSKFLILSAFSTIVWGITYGSIGYLFGEVIKSKLHHIEDIEKYVMGVLLLLGVIFVLLRLRRRNRPILQPVQPGK
jgi:membrane protein DedA with SNARE-associated domain